MSVSLTNFVDINIQKHVDTIVKGTRDTVALFTDYGNKGTETTINSLAEATEKYYGKSGAEKTYEYLKVYFDNGGVKVIVYEGHNSLSEVDVAALPDDVICVASTLTIAVMKAIAKVRLTIVGIKEKLILASTTDKSIIDEESVKNFIVKYSSITGAEMTIAAYLSKIDVYKINSVFDYMFTQETIATESISDDEYKKLIAANYNVNIELANASRACGGNCKDGAEITNNFVRIVLHQTLTQRLIQLLTTKLKSNSGLGKIYTTIAQELNYYLRDGYLTTDKIWTDEDWTVVGADGVTYTIIEKGTALTNGYIAKILPLSSLTANDKAEHKAPNIYIVIADQYAIRKIEITGQVI